MLLKIDLEKKNARRKSFLKEVISKVFNSAG